MIKIKTATVLIVIVLTNDCRHTDKMMDAMAATQRENLPQALARWPTPFE